MKIIRSALSIRRFEYKRVCAITAIARSLMGAHRLKFGSV